MQYSELENYARTLRSRLQELELHNEALEEQTYAATMRAQKAEARATRHRGLPPSSFRTRPFLRTSVTVLLVFRKFWITISGSLFPAFLEARCEEAAG